MAQTTTTPEGNLFAQVLAPANRPDPYPLYARLRERPVSQQEDGIHVVSTYAEIIALLHDPRISSDERKSVRGAGALVASGRLRQKGEEGNPPFIFLDPPDHDRLRRIVMRQFTPQRISAMHERIARLVAGFLDARRGGDRLDLVADLAYPLPVTVICELLGVPHEDETRFHAWAAALARGLDPAQGMSEGEVQQAMQAAMQMLGYMGELIAARRAEPKDDLLSGLVAGGGPAERMSPPDLLRTTALLLIAGHETTVNLISNGMLSLLRHPRALDRLRHEPDFVIPLTEEVLRYDPPVQFRTRTTLTDITVADVTIPKGATVALLLASGNRDPARFPDSNRFVPERGDNAHLGFGGGIHYCVGAPLARMEAHVALSALARRLVAPRLLVDPPPYRENASLRGPARLLVGFERLAD